MEEKKKGKDVPKYQEISIYLLFNIYYFQNN